MMRNVFLSLPLALLLAACGGPAVPSQSGRITVVATTSIIGDVVSQVIGDQADLKVLIRPGQDPHSFEASPADASIIEHSAIVFANGLDLEESLLPMLAAAPQSVEVVRLSDGLSDLRVEKTRSTDPHTWQDPGNVKAWVDRIAESLAQVDPPHAAVYHQNAETYKMRLDELDVYIRKQVERIPPDQRKLVTNHDALGYFADRYGFTLIGTVYKSGGEASEPSAGAMADVIAAIKQSGVHAIFVENTANDQVARVIAEEVGYPVSILTLYTDALDKPGAPGDSYIGMMKSNIDTIVSGLAGN